MTGGVCFGMGYGLSHRIGRFGVNLYLKAPMRCLDVRIGTTRPNLMYDNCFPPPPWKNVDVPVLQGSFTLFNKSNQYYM